MKSTKPPEFLELQLSNYMSGIWLEGAYSIDGEEWMQQVFAALKEIGWEINPKFKPEPPIPPMSETTLKSLRAKDPVTWGSKSYELTTQHFTVDPPKGDGLFGELTNGDRTKANKEVRKVLATHGIKVVPMKQLTTIDML